MSPQRGEAVISAERLVLLASVANDHPHPNVGAEIAIALRAHAAAIRECAPLCVSDEAWPRQQDVAALINDERARILSILTTGAP